ncbi:MAG: cytochrome c [Ectothiorhodospiraceae bacterium]
MVLLGLALMAAVPAQAQETTLPAGPNRDLVYGKCRTCHSLQYIKDSAGITRDRWAGVLGDMAMFGLDINDAQREKILTYLGTYLGPNPPSKSEKADGGKEQTVAGKTLFTQQCSSCHKEDGTGRSGEFPPLAGNPDLFLSDDYPALVLLNGLHGSITVNGETFNGQMPSFGYLSDEKIAGLIHYVRGAWGNADNRPGDMSTITSEEVAALREKSMDTQAVHAYREKLGGD